VNVDFQLQCHGHSWKWMGGQGSDLYQPEYHHYQQSGANATDVGR